MADEPTGPAPAPLSLPDAPDLDWLRKQAKRRLAELRRADVDVRLADAQRDLARRYGFPSWRALKAHVDSLTVDGRLFDAARRGDAGRLGALLDAHPHRLHARARPHEWTLLHVAAHAGHLEAVDLLLRRGLDPNARERGDDTYAMHWAAAAGHVDVVRRLVDAGGDVVGRGDDHELEVIGWATCWDGCDDAAHRAVAELLVIRGARHHVFSAVALGLADEVRRIVAADPSALARPMSRNEGRQLPLHFAVRKGRAEMVALLLELGADPAAVDAAGMPAAAYAAAPEVDRRVLEALARGGVTDVFSALALGDETAAARLLGGGGVPAGALHLAAKRGDARAVRWLLARGADPNARWSHWGAEVAPLHLAAAQGHAAVVRLLLDAGADPRVRDGAHDGDAAGWAEHGRVPPAAGWREIVRMLEAHAGRA
jgi:ankyrin repeat protein